MAKSREYTRLSCGLLVPNRVPLLAADRDDAIPLVNGSGCCQVSNRIEDDEYEFVQQALVRWADRRFK